MGLPNLIAAFNTADHTFLLDRMRVAFGIVGLALEWIKRFLVDRTQQNDVHLDRLNFGDQSLPTSCPAIHGRIV
jgi:hypothetical protein